MNASFFEDVYEVVKCIPKGRVTTYGAIARYLGTGKSSRMVGWAMNHSHSAYPNLPAHRVVNRTGLLTGKAFFGPGNEMANLLENEGIAINGDQILDFKTCFWDPNDELNIP